MTRLTISIIAVVSHLGLMNKLLSKSKTQNDTLALSTYASVAGVKVRVANSPSNMKIAFESFSIRSIL